MDASSKRGVYVQSDRSVGWRIADQEAQVFVDHSGRRARRVRIVGAAMAGLCALWLTGLVIGVAGFTGFPAVRSPFRLLPSLARIDTTHAAARRVEARELVLARAPSRARES